VSSVAGRTLADAFEPASWESLDRSAVLRQRITEYCARGWGRLIPLAPGTKAPYTPLLPGGSWLPLAEHPSLAGDVLAWFDAVPRLNLGLATGHGVDVADIDIPVGTAALRALLELRTPIVKTSRDHLHIYLKGGGQNMSTPYGSIRGHNQYVPIPPSTHPDGDIYTWIWLPDTLATMEQFFEVAQEIGLYEPGVEALRHQRQTQVVNPYSLLASQLASPVRAAEVGPNAAEDSLPTRLDDWDRDMSFVARARDLLSIPAVPLGKHFRCVLPGHRELHPSAALILDGRGRVVYHDFHHRDGREFYTLADVFASQTAGTAIASRGPRLAIWKLRLLNTLGYIESADVDLMTSAPPLSPTARRVLTGFNLLLRVRWASAYGEPAPFTWRFAAHWCGMSQKEAGAGLQELRRLGVIVKIRTEKRIPYYLPTAAGTGLVGEARQLLTSLARPEPAAGAR
jgi:Bifunctional DNA primase/polymerase, N-terminal